MNSQVLQGRVTGALPNHLVTPITTSLWSWTVALGFVSLVYFRSTSLWSCWVGWLLVFLFLGNGEASWSFPFPGAEGGQNHTKGGWQKPWCPPTCGGPLYHEELWVRDIVQSLNGMFCGSGEMGDFDGGGRPTLSQKLCLDNIRQAVSDAGKPPDARWRRRSGSLTGVSGQTRVCRHCSPGPDGFRQAVAPTEEF